VSVHREFGNGIVAAGWKLNGQRNDEKKYLELTAQVREAKNHTYKVIFRNGQEN